MFSEGRRIHLIEELLRTQDEHTLIEVESLLEQSKRDKPFKKSAHDFVGLWSKKDASLMEKAINEGCEQVNAADWK